MNWSILDLFLPWDYFRVGLLSESFRKQAMGLLIFWCRIVTGRTVLGIQSDVTRRKSLQIRKLS